MNVSLPPQEKEWVRIADLQKKYNISRAKLAVILKRNPSIKCARMPSLYRECNSWLVNRASFEQWLEELCNRKEEIAA